MPYERHDLVDQISDRVGIWAMTHITQKKQALSFLKRSRMLAQRVDGRDDDRWRFRHEPRHDTLVARRAAPDKVGGSCRPRLDAFQAGGLFRKTLLARQLILAFEPDKADVHKV